MLPVLVENEIRITNVEVISDKGGYYSIVSFSDGKFDEFGPYDTYEEARSSIY